MSAPLKVLFIAAEANPLAKVGGLADVVGSLPAALAKLGHDVRIALPYHASIDPGAFRMGAVYKGLEVALFGRKEQADVHRTHLNGGVPVYLVDSLRYFRRAVYGEPDDLERFLFFSLSALKVPRMLSWRPDVFHAHDWHAAAAVKSLDSLRRRDAFYAPCASLFTIHNLQYQGNFEKEWLRRALQEDSNGDEANCMIALGILYADAVSTVSESYAREITTPEYGFGMENLLQRRQDGLFGIVNGIDYEELDPAKDRRIPFNYSASNLEPRALNKKALQQRTNLPERPDVPVLGMVSRLADQKGIDILIHALNTLLGKADIQFIIQGLGEKKYYDLLGEIVSRYPQKACAIHTFDPSLAQLIYAGCDIFLMPSRFEPCGLGQLIAMRYGSIPLVRSTGGLADTVQDCSPDLKRGNGFVFRGYSAGELCEVVERALRAFAKKKQWQKLMVRAMSEDHSWEDSAKKYESLYRKAIELKKAREGGRRR
ncbi:MAG: glycogen synthase [Chloroflexi bacterium]|nr:glycogen synthase [Chloroflexota bacterium]